MINKDFYPTPQTLIHKMVNNVDFSLIKNVLEPSAGKGDICDYIKRDKINIDCIEIEKDLRFILEGKGYNVIFDDFLNFNTYKKYDLIIANFPFSDGDKHLLKSLLLLEKFGGNLICLVNAETLKNPYSNTRKIIKQKLEINNANIEYLNNEFKNAERKTNVEVALIKVIIEKNDNSIVLDNLDKGSFEEYKENNNQIVEKDFLKQLISRFNFECKVGSRLIKEYNYLKPFIMNKIENKNDKYNYNNPIIELKISGNEYGDNDNNLYLKQLRAKYWRLLLTNENFIKNYTSNIVNELREKVEELRDYDFSLFNIEKIKERLNKKIISGIEDSIINLFDEFSREYSYNKDYGNNIHYFNGWKTNKAHYINKKVIIPFNCYNWSGSLDVWRVKEKLNDIVKVFNYLSKDKINNTEILVGKSVEEYIENDYKSIGLQFFDLKFYKKGTCHIVFKDEELLRKFNIYGSQKKGWLPPSYGNKKYSEMSSEEKKIIDEFQGKNSYNNVINNKDYYIVKNDKFLLT